MGVFMPWHNFFSRMPFMKPHCRIKSPTTTPLNQPLHQSLPFLWRRWVRQRRGRFRKPWCSWAKPGSSPRRPGSRWRATCVSKSKKIGKQLIIFKCRTLVSTHFLRNRGNYWPPHFEFCIPGILFVRHPSLVHPHLAWLSVSENYPRFLVK